MIGLNIDKSGIFIEAGLIDLVLIWPNTGQLESIGVPANPRYILEKGSTDLDNSIKDDPGYLLAHPLVVFPHAGNYILIEGNMRRQSCVNNGMKQAPCLVLHPDTPSEKLITYMLKGNISYGKWDYDLLNNHFSIDHLSYVGLELPEINLDDHPSMSDNEDNSAADPEAKLTLHFKGNLGEYDNIKKEIEKLIAKAKTMEEQKEKKKSNRGRKRKYTAAMGLQMAEIYGMGRAKVEEICKQFEISTATFFQWQIDFPEFSDAISHFKNARRENIGDMALNGLELLLTKHEFEEVQTEYETYIDPVTKQEKAKVIGIKKTKKFVMPSQAMVKFALINVKDKEWKDSSHIDHTSGGEALGFSTFLMQTKAKLEKPAEEGKPEEAKVENVDYYVPTHRE
nr:hypothetical protein [Tanacetum cinerariifolium]